MWSSALSEGHIFIDSSSIMQFHSNSVVVDKVKDQSVESMSGLCSTHRAFTHVILTAPSAAIAVVYQTQINLLKKDVAFLQQCQMFCVSDPEGCRVGSGGGTVNVIDFLVSEKGMSQTDFQNAKILIIHSGGDSRRAPLYSLCGKAWITVNASADSALANPVLLLIQEISAFCQHLPTHSLVVASSDVMLHIFVDKKGPQTFAENAVSVVCVPEAPSVAKNHGVFIPEIESIQAAHRTDQHYHGDITRGYLQKPSIESMKSNNAVFMKDGEEKALIDTGVVIFTGQALDSLVSLLKDIATNDSSVGSVIARCTSRGIKSVASAVDISSTIKDTTTAVAEESVKHTHKPEVLRFELYSDILLALRSKDQVTSTTTATKNVNNSLESYFQRLNVSVPSLQNADNTTNALSLYEQALLVLHSKLSDIPLHYIYVPSGCFTHLGTMTEVLTLFGTATTLQKAAQLEYELECNGGDTSTSSSSSTSASNVVKPIDPKLSIFASKYGLQTNVKSRLLLNENVVLTEELVTCIVENNIFVNSYMALDANNKTVESEHYSTGSMETDSYIAHNENYNHYCDEAALKATLQQQQQQQQQEELDTDTTEAESKDAALSTIADKSDAIKSSSTFIEHSVLTNSCIYTLPSGSMLSHLSAILAHKLTPSTLTENTMIQQVCIKHVPYGNTKTDNVETYTPESAFTLLLFNSHDDIKANYLDTSKATICGANWDTFFKVSRTTPADIWPDLLQKNTNIGEVTNESSAPPAGEIECTLWNAKLFPICRYNPQNMHQIDMLFQPESSIHNNAGVDAAPGRYHTLTDSILSLTWFTTLVSNNDNYQNATTDRFDAIAIWRQAQRVSLADLLHCGDAFKMLQWRTLLSTVYGGPTSLGVGVVNGQPSYGQLAKYRTVTSLYTLVANISLLFEAVSSFQCKLLKWSAGTQKTEDSVLKLLPKAEFVMLFLWCSRLVLSHPHSSDSSSIDATSLTTVDELLLKSLNVLLPGQNKLNSHIVQDFRTLWETVMSAENSSELSLLAIEYFRALVVCEDDVVTVCDALVECCDFVSVESQPRLLFLLAHLVSDVRVSSAAEAICKEVLANLETTVVECGQKNVNVADGGLSIVKQQGAAIIHAVWAKHLRPLFTSDMLSPVAIDRTITFTAAGSVSDVLEAVGQRIVSLHAQYSLDSQLNSCTPPAVLSTDSDANDIKKKRNVTDRVELTQTSLLDKNDVTGDKNGVTADKNKVYLSSSPVRIDIAGGWSDTPPICYELGGAVLNMGVLVDDTHPIKCVCRITTKPVIALHSLRLKKQQEDSDDNDSDVDNNDDDNEDDDEDENGEGKVDSLASGYDDDCVICDTNEVFKDIHNDTPCCLVKAVLVILGVVTPYASSSELMETETLSERLQRVYGGGIEIACLSTLPSGSGMGGSSILAAAILRSVAACLQIELTNERLVDLVSAVEQLLTTGGGWQDQIGAIYGGFKIARCPAQLPVRVTVESVETSPACRQALEERMFLIYTGKQRLAKNTLINALRRCALTPSFRNGTDSPTHTNTSTVSQLVLGAELGATLLKKHSQTMDDLVRSVKVTDAATVPVTLTEAEIESREEKELSMHHNAVDELAAVLNNYWELKKEMAAGSEPPYIATILNYLRPLCEGLSLCGAGAGGFGVVILKRGTDRQSLEQSVVELNRILAHQFEDCAESSMLTVHAATVDIDGIVTTEMVVGEETELCSIFE